MEMPRISGGLQKVGREVDKLQVTTTEDIVEQAAVLIQAFPVLGGLASGIALFTTSNRRWERLVKFLRSVEDRLDDWENLSDDHEEIVVEILERVVRERSDEKTECFRSILFTSLRDTDFNYDRSLELVKLTERLTVNHIRPLRVVSDPISAIESAGGKVSIERPANSLSGLLAGDVGLFFVAPFFADWSGNDLRRIWEELCDSHVLQRISPKFRPPKADETIDADLIALILKQYISQYGHEYLQYILISE